MPACGPFCPYNLRRVAGSIGSVDIRIREAGIGDIEHILHHRRAMFEEMGYRDEAVLDRMEAASREYFGAALQNGTYRGWLAERPDRQIVAGGGIVISAWPGHPGEGHARRAWILNMYTEPGARRRGVARRLMEAMIAWCRAHGFSTVSLHASAAGRPLYETMGFEPTNEMRLKLR